MNTDLALDNAKRGWTQGDIIAATEQQHSGPGFFKALAEVCLTAFGGAFDYSPGQYMFRMGDLTIGDVLDFFADHRRTPVIEWANNFGPEAYIAIDDFTIAAEFEKEFDIPPLSPLEWQRLTEI